jgi:SAM-dependent methyltransferase
MKNFIFDEWAYNDKSAKEIVPYLIKEYEPKNVVDVGCGIGTWLSVFSNLGVKISGIDGSLYSSQFRIPQSSYIQFDLIREFTIDQKFDLVICLEVAEHLPPEAAQTLISSLTKLGDRIIFSAAIPGQGGQGHLNEQWPSYWFEIFQKFGFGLSDKLRNSLWTNENIHWWYRQNILIAERGINVDKKPLNMVHPNCFNQKIDLLDAIESGRIGLKTLLKYLLNGIKYKRRKR